ncbi:MAG: DUF3575 domain-containing protein [Tidjanibacter sp.]|nr:DUF3575 domain-containing protein [Tidjanibacter sp.]
MKRYLSIFLALAFSFCSLSAQSTTMRNMVEHSDVVLYFRFDKSVIDPSYKDNANSLRKLDALLNKYGDEIDSIQMTAYASPEGPSNYNNKLSARRADYMSRYITNHYRPLRDRISVVAGGEDFDGFLQMLAEDDNIPDKAAVMKLINNSAGSNDQLFYQISKIASGRPYRYIRQNILPNLRTVITVVCYFGEQPIAVLADEVKTKPSIEAPLFNIIDRHQGEVGTEEIPIYTYIINKSRFARPDAAASELSTGMARYDLQIFKENVLEGEYSLVAPNGITNLNGWYSLVTALSDVGHALAGGFDAEGKPVATYISLDSCKAVLTEGRIHITQHEEDNRIDVEGENVTLTNPDGTTVPFELKQLDCAGDGISSALYYVVTASPVEGLEGVSRYTVTVTDDFSGVVGEYSLVAPNGITNLNGWYSLTTTPETQSQAIAGSFDADSRPTETYIADQGRAVALRQGSVTVTQRDDNSMDIVCEGVVGVDAEGNEVRRQITLRNIQGNGVPFVENGADKYATEGVSPTVRRGFALKTNLLYDAVTAVNIAAEIPLGKRFSVEASWTFPWWLPKNWSWCNELLWGEVEGRYWLGDRSKRGMLQGHFVGAYFGTGLYDFQFNDDRGNQGEFIEAGIGYGYSMPLKCGLNLEFELGLGFMQTDYRSYIHTTKADGSEVLFLYRTSDPNRPLQYFGPTKAKVSLVWPITWNSKTRRSAK